MRDYRAYIFGIDNHRYQKVAQFARDHIDDLTAMKAAEQLVDGHDVELWESARLVARFDHKSGSVICDRSPLEALRTVASESLAPTVEITKSPPKRLVFWRSPTYVPAATLIE
jgi:hypothetical protein